MKKRALSLFISLCLLVSVLPLLSGAGLPGGYILPPLNLIAAEDFESMPLGPVLTGGVWGVTGYGGSVEYENGADGNRVLKMVNQDTYGLSIYFDKQFTGSGVFYAAFRGKVDAGSNLAKIAVIVGTADGYWGPYFNLCNPLYAGFPLYEPEAGWYDEWHDFIIEIDCDYETWSLYIDGVEVFKDCGNTHAPTGAKGLDNLQFYFSGAATMYVDDILVGSLTDPEDPEDPNEPEDPEGPKGPEEPEDPWIIAFDNFERFAVGTPIGGIPNWQPEGAGSGSVASVDGSRVLMMTTASQYNAYRYFAQQQIGYGEFTASFRIKVPAPANLLLYLSAPGGYWGPVVALYDYPYANSRYFPDADWYGKWHDFSFVVDSDREVFTLYIDDEEVFTDAAFAFTKESAGANYPGGMNSFVFNIAGGGGAVYIDDLQVSAPSYYLRIQSLLPRLAAMEDKLPDLAALLDLCKSGGIPVDYELINYTIIKRFIQYGRDDYNEGYFSRAEYIANVLENLYDEAVADLNAYIAGIKTALEVPRYVTGDSRSAIDGYSFLANTRTSLGTEEADRPVFFNGYGHFERAEWDIVNFNDFGANIIQCQIGTDAVIYSKDNPPEYWKTIAGGADAAFTADKTVFYSGETSMKLVNNTPATENKSVKMTQTVQLKPERTYVLTAIVKGENVSGAYLLAEVANYHVNLKGALPDGTYDWQEVTFEFNTEPWYQYMTEIGILSEDVAGALWIDDIKLTQKNSALNLALDNGFEYDIEFVGDYAINMQRITYILSLLDDAERHNMVIDLLLSPHYFPGWALAKWPEIRYNDPSSWIPVSINAPRAREIEELFLATIIPLIKDSPALNSLCLTNEPTYNSQLDPFATPLWREFLEGKYGTIEQLNEMYGTFYAGFTQVPMPGGKAPNLPFYDWVCFNNAVFAGWHSWMAGIIKDITPDIPLHAKVMMNKWGAWGYGVEFEDFAELSDISGNDNWYLYDVLGNGRYSYVSQMSFLDMQASLKYAPIMDSECHPIPDGIMDNYIPAQVNHMETFLWQGAARGRSAATIWVWERCYNYALSSLMGCVLERPDVVKAVGKANLDMNRLAYELTALQNAPSYTAILYSQTSAVYVAEYQYYEETAYGALVFNGQKVRYVSEKQAQAGGFSGYKLLIVPNSTHVNAATLEAIKEFIEAGGTVVLYGENALSRDENNRLHDPDVRQYVYDNSVVASSFISGADLKIGFKTILDELGLTRVALKDRNTGLPADGIDWFCAEYNGSLLINIVNCDLQAKTVVIEIDGVTVGTVDELINGGKINTEGFTLQPEKPYLLSVNATEPAVEKAVPSAYVEKLNGNQNRLFITIKETYSDGTVKVIEWNGLINNNAAGFYNVGAYKVYVDTKGNTQIRACYIAG